MFTDAAPSRVRVTAAASALRPRPEAPAVAKQEGAAIRAIVLQGVGRGHGDDGRWNQARASAAIAATAGASAGAASARRGSRSHRDSNQPNHTKPKTV
jgi:hypothetical protein